MLKNLKPNEIGFIVVYILLCLIGMYHTPLFDEDEGFFAEAARNMLRTGEYVEIKVNGEWRYDKPPLFMWLEVICFRFFGITQFSARLPSYLAFLAHLVLLYSFVKKEISYEKAFISVLVGSGILQFQILSKAAVVDNLLNLFIALSMCAIFDFYKSGSKRKMYYFWIGIGLAFLTKGPIGFLPLCIFSLFLLFKRDYSFFLKVLNYRGVILSTIILFPWFYLAFQKTGKYFLYDIFIKHNLGRFTYTMENHGGSIFYYVPILFISFLPFLHLFKNLKNNRLKDDRTLFLTTWCVFVFVFFSFSKTQLPHYISYCYFPLIVLLINGKVKDLNWLYIQLAFIYLLFLCLPFLAEQITKNTSNSYVRNLLSNSSVTFNDFYLAFVLLFAMLSIAFRKSIIVLTLLFIGCFSFVLNRYAHLQQGFVLKAAKLIPQNSQVWMLDHYNPSLSFYLDQSIPIANGLPNSRSYVFLTVNRLPNPQYDIIESENGMALVRVK